MMHIARLRTLEDHGDRRALLCPDQILLYSRNGQQRRDRNVVFVHAAIGKDQNIRAGVIRLVAGDKQPLQRKRER